VKGKRSLLRAIRTAGLYGLGGASFVLLSLVALSWTWLGRYQTSFYFVQPKSQVIVGIFPRAIILRRQSVTWSLRPQRTMRHGNFSIDQGDDVGDDLGSTMSLHALGDAAVRSMTRTYASRSGGAPHAERELTAWVPYWLLLPLLSALPLWLVTTHRVRRRGAARRSRGQCATCGYDLRATPNRCPECGAVVRRGLRAWLSDAVRRCARASKTETSPLRLGHPSAAV